MLYYNKIQQGIYYIYKYIIIQLMFVPRLFFMFLIPILPNSICSKHPTAPSDRIMSLAVTVIK